MPAPLDEIVWRSAAKPLSACRPLSEHALGKAVSKRIVRHRVVAPGRAIAVLALVGCTFTSGCVGANPPGTSTTPATASATAPSPTPSVTGPPERLRVKAGVADAGFAAAQLSGVLARTAKGCLALGNVLLVLPENAMEFDDDVLISGESYSPGDTITGSGGYLTPDAVAQVMDRAGLAAWKACGAPQQTAVIADPSTIS